jgi:GMP synthase-like glutamine amidotransferase
LNGKEEYLISEFHGDAVVKVPQGFTIVGQSETCLNEAMSSNDGRVLSYQFHMEYTPEFAGAFELRLHSYDPNCRYGRIYDGSSKIQGCDRNLRSVL